MGHASTRFEIAKVAPKLLVKSSEKRNGKSRTRGALASRSPTTISRQYQGGHPVSGDRRTPADTATR
jgi:hypothetical protein